MLILEQGILFTGNLRRSVLNPGDVIDGKYRVVRALGAGGMGAVFEGHSIRLNRRVAMKVLHASMAKQKTLVARFEREAQAAANIGSVHVVDVFDLGDLPNGDRYMIMEFLEGESLQARLDAVNQLTPLVIAEIVIQLLDGLEKVHAAGIIHRDLKPANVFLARGEGGTDLVKILDFGVCKFTQPAAKAKDVSTGVGAVLGTLGYMSPEQVEFGSKDLDGRADLYAVGVLLYRAVTGKLPYGASTVIDLLKMLREGRAPHVADLAGGVDKVFSGIVTKSLEWDRTARYASAKELRQALVGWMAGLARIEEVLSDFLGTDAEPSSKTVGKVSLVRGARGARGDRNRPNDVMRDASRDTIRHGSSIPVPDGVTRSDSGEAVDVHISVDLEDDPIRGSR
jgi:eukaryotic-like serine/threonine-protein kinase